MSVASTDELDRGDMESLAGGEAAALDRLMERHAERLFHYMVRSLQSEEEAEDLAQETFVRVYESRQRFDRRLRFVTWLYAIASNLVRDRFRWRSRHPQISFEAENPEGLAPLSAAIAADSSDPSEELETSERAAAVRRAVGKLPEDLRLPLILAEYEGLSQSEIAEILKCTVKAVETRIYRARKRLRPELAELTHG